MRKHLKICRDKKIMIDIDYSLVIKATDEPDFFGFYSPDLKGFTGIGQSIEDCIYKAKWGMRNHVDLLNENNMPVPPKNPKPQIIIQNSTRELTPA